MYAISTPMDDQYNGDGIAVRGIAYGIPTIRVDGNDLLAVYKATQEARKIITTEGRPALIEFISYRRGDHSTSDFSERYRDQTEMKKWEELLSKINSPIDRFQNYLISKKLINSSFQQEVREKAKKEVRNALKESSQLKKPKVEYLFTDVYKEMP